MTPPNSNVSEEEYNALMEELEELRSYKKAWEEMFPGLTPQDVRQMEEQLYELYQEKVGDKENAFPTDYQQSLKDRVS